MSLPEANAIRFHDDADLFREAVNFTAADTAFAARLVEKDYFCTVLLAHVAAHTGAPLVFKGATCLTKVHADFYRLSEDLDFALPVPVDASRAERSRRAAGVKRVLAGLPRAVPCFRVVEPMKGANNSTHYTGVVGYTSLLSGQGEVIRLEVGLREPLLTAATEAQARTILRDPVTGRPMVPEFGVRCMAKLEAFAEKFRAALTRREVAIRDFFDIDYAVRRLGMPLRDGQLINLVRQKLAVPGNEPVQVSEQRLADLKRQLGSQLRPVLRERDFLEFDLQRAFRVVAEMAEMVG
ncbi:MAG: nucleotidyl transferase AbiEii/AbiGii toxin family protein [Planctomycetes bacterium]|nr:nucleotidyl transferase AbiEii/AbiGii toxin family protein [Planctomycetota bacterium]MBM4084578.1 nucleotidyl transferase AbiEii/AbiGii toxin family protein [Planctomycetota bacterium]